MSELEEGEFVEEGEITEEFEQGAAVELGAWDDSELIDTWDLAVQEYKKYYSIKATEQRSNTKNAVNTVSNPTKTTKKRKKSKKRNIEPQLQSILLPGCTCSNSNHPYLLESMNLYYKGYEDGHNDTIKQSTSPWYLAGYEASKVHSIYSFVLFSLSFPP
jgi:hypothetical protein